MIGFTDPEGYLYWYMYAYSITRAILIQFVIFILSCAFFLCMSAVLKNYFKDRISAPEEYANKDTSFYQNMIISGFYYSTVPIYLKTIASFVLSIIAAYIYIHI